MEIKSKFYIDWIILDYKVNIKISNHAKERVKTYNLTEKIIIDTIKNPDELIESYGGTLIAHKLLNEHLLREVYTKEENTIKVVTVYPAKKERYRRKNES